MVGPTREGEASPRRTWAKAAALLAAALATVPLLVATTVSGYNWAIVPIAATTVGVAWGVRRLSGALPALPWLLIGMSGAIAVVSILTGRLNGLSDEPYSTPAYASLGLGMYLHPVQFGYVEYGRHLVENSYDVYLPLLTFVQIPGVDYRWVALAAWAVLLLLVRYDRFALGGLATPWIALLAANGQNDFVALAAFAASVTLPATRYRWVVEFVALGLKQFVNLLLLGYHLLRRDYAAALGTVAGTLLILLPFLLVGPQAVVCHVVAGDPGSGCSPHSAAFVLFKRNYWLYPVAVVLLFHRPIGDRLRRLLAYGQPDPDRPGPTEGVRPADRSPGP